MKGEWMRILKFSICCTLVFIGPIFVLNGCQSSSKVPLNSQNDGTNPASLSWVAAQKRASSVSQVRYQIRLRTPQDQQSYLGEVVIHFLYIPTSEPLRIDFREGEIQKLVVNAQLKNAKYNQSYLLVNSADLKRGQNEIQIQFVQKYSQSGAGLHRFSDPEDQSVYLWTQLEPFNANLFFPCFDQPNLKATYSMQVHAPASWKVISTMDSSEVKSIDKDWNQWDFPESPRMSTYLFSLFAGPYKEWRSQAGTIPLGLFARKSLSKFVDENEWFDLTKEGLKFFPGYFNFPYPFSKLDQIIVPEASFGGMENLAAISYSEELVSRGKRTEKEKQSLAETLLHELAHMWFGDLVTMDWWNDLWLNESFATYLEALATSRVSRSQSPWFEFYANAKKAAYHEDQMITTHPVEGIVNTTDDIQGAFDAITYGKGAAVFKQLNYFIGEEKFRKGLENYFKTYAFKNATLKNFMESMSKGANIDLVDWSDSWLKESGVDEVDTSFMCRKNKLRDLHFQITSPNPGRRRSHAFEVALLRTRNGRLHVYHSFPVRAEASRIAQIHFQNVSCPEAVFVNYQDHAYIKVNLDKKSLATLSTTLSTIADPLVRLMTWETFWQMVRDQKISLQEYVALVQKHFSKETNPDIILQVASTISGSLASETNSVLNFWPRRTELDKTERGRFGEQMENLYWQKTESSPAGTDIKKIWFQLFVQIAHTPRYLQTLSDLLRGERELPGLDLDMDLKWTVLASLCRYDFPTHEKLLTSYSQEDVSERGQRGKLACEVLIPKAENKKKWYQEIKEANSTYSHALLTEILRNLVPPEQVQFQTLYRDDFFSLLKTESTHRDELFTLRLAYFLVPKNCTEQSAKKLRMFAEQEKSLLPAVRIELLKASEEEIRCVKIRVRAEI